MWEFSELTHEEAAQQRRRYEPLTASVRKLIDATLRTEADEEVVTSVTSEIDAAADKLRKLQVEGTLGVSLTPDGQPVAWGNMANGLRNPLAPPILIQRDGAVKARLDVELGAAYEGAPGHLHGGYGALVLDHLFGDVASYGSPDTVAATGTITYRYQRPTRLGPLRAEAEIQNTDGRKIFVAGHLADAEGVTVTAEGVFIALRR
jgi:acyl-coenzyme A thioesterase PaaI-like protein